MSRRRCEPSPLVPPDHPDAAKLPCARCRRFALECIRVKVSKRKGPAPVYVPSVPKGCTLTSSDLSAISDAAYGFVAPAPPQETPNMDTIPLRQFSSGMGDSQPMLTGMGRQSSES
jgi:hypothetical protein